MVLIVERGDRLWERVVFGLVGYCGEVSVYLGVVGG